VKWKISWRNLMMYNSLIPDIGNRESDLNSSNTPKPNKTLSNNQEISLFEIGLRLDQGLGV